MDIETYEAPSFANECPASTRYAVAHFVAAIAIILAFFASAGAWCWWVCRNNGGVSSCKTGWLSAEAYCRY